MENKEVVKKKERKRGQHDEADGFFKRDSQQSPLSAMSRMDSFTAVIKPKEEMDGVHVKAFTRERLFRAAFKGDSSHLDGLLDYLTAHNKKLSRAEFKDESNGQTVLMRALLHLKDQRNDTIGVFLDAAENTNDLKAFINSEYKGDYQGQTALHIAIERRSFEHVKLLVQKGADVQAKANGKFFQNNEQPGFYFGELPLSLAACTNQPEVVSFLMDNPYKRADVTDRDSEGNTVLHALVVLADNTDENTDMIARMYDSILIQHHKLDKENEVQLEEIENNQKLTPLKLSAKLGKIGLFRHIMHREFQDKETRPLSMKFVAWVYGPVQSSLYDIDSIDTVKDNSVLKILVYGNEIPNRTEMLRIEPLCSLLKNKWTSFAATLFFVHFLIYVAYLAVFTIMAINRKEEKFPIQPSELDPLSCVGEVICVLGAVWFLCKAILNLIRNHPKWNTLYIDGFCDIMFFLQAALLLVSAILYICQRIEYVGLLVISQALAWVNVLYYTRGTKQLGIYNVMVQRMILGDIFNFLFVYAVFLFGFTTAIMTLMKDPPSNSTAPYDKDTSEKSSYTDTGFTILELFKFTIGMGNLEFTQRVQYKGVFFLLLIMYVILTYILLLNMLIALMGNTVETTSNETENIWNLQRALTILDMEQSLLRCLKTKVCPGKSEESNIVSLDGEDGKTRRFLRVEEMNWTEWRSDLCIFHEEDSGNHVKNTSQSQDLDQNWITGNLGNRIDQIIERFRSSTRRRSHPPDLP